MLPLRQEGMCIVEILEKALYALLTIIWLVESRVEPIRICIFGRQWEIE